MKDMYDGDDIDLLYVLRPHGWSEVFFYVGGEVHHLCLTHVFSDPTADLIELAAKLHKRAKSIELTLWDEPGGYSLQCAQVSDRHHMYTVRLCSFPEDFGSASRTETVLTEFEVKANHFVKLIHGELEKTFTLLEEQSYRQHRNFPYTEFKELRALLSR